MIVEIDPGSGFCFGVTSAIHKAEEQLGKENNLYCIGEIVHNQAEVNRLKQKGLVTVERHDMQHYPGKTILIRAHGEPPETYEIAEKYHIGLIDATCPVVLKIQQRIKQAYEAMKKINGQVVIYGKKGHAEVEGLLGQTAYTGLLIENINDLDSIDFERPVELFSQTTQSIDSFYLIAEEIKKKSKAWLKIHDTICRQVSNRIPQLLEFVAKYDVIVFVSGKNSSNGKLLFEICKGKNANTYHVSDVSEINERWFSGKEKAGICGATSTPHWVMDEVAERIRNL